MKHETLELKKDYDVMFRVNNSEFLYFVNNTELIN